MIIEKKIKLNNNSYYIVLNIEYKIGKNDMMKLCLKDYEDDYYDSGNFSKLIEKIEKEYEYKKTQKYDRNISFMNDVLYIFDRIPFLTGIKDVCISDKDTIPSSTCYISKSEIERYIKDNNVKMNINSKFKLYDERTWKI